MDNSLKQIRWKRTLETRAMCYCAREPFLINDARSNALVYERQINYAKVVYNFVCWV